MKPFSDALAEAYASWLNSVTLCCAPCLAEKKPPRRYNEKDIVVFRDQPGFTPQPSFEPVSQDAASYRRERAPRKSLSSIRGRSLSVRRRFTSNASSTRRPQISAPSDFRHLYSDTFQFPHMPYQPQQRRPRPTSFRPIELSIYMPDNILSPILPHFDYQHPDVTPPPAAHTHHGSSFDSDGVTLAHERSYSSMSFHLPRRGMVDTTPAESVTGTPPTIPPRSRLRAYTSPDVDRIVERIASAMIEKERLQAEIDEVVERQSIYINSRPSTAYGMEDLEPMPSIPALPAAAPSFAERLSIERPQTAPPKSTEVLRGDRGFSTPPRQATPTKSTSRINGRPVDVPLAPPLPLVLRPPLRKKKSFSRVSNWLFPGEDGQHQRSFSQDSITNAPRPVTGREGFYQCIGTTDLKKHNDASTDSLSTVSTWTTEEDRTMPTTWSPGSSPVTKLDTPTPTGEKRATFGRTAANTHRPQSVGVAF